MFKSLLNKFDEYFSWITGLLMGYEDVPSTQEMIGEWIKVAELECDQFIIGKNGNEAKVGEVTAIVEQNTHSGRLRGYYCKTPSGVRTFFDGDEVGKVLVNAKKMEFLQSGDFDKRMTS